MIELPNTVGEGSAGALLASDGPTMASIRWVAPESGDDDGRRRWRRVPVNGDITVIHPGRATGVVVDVSRGGMRIAIDRPLAMGDRFLCDVRLGDGQLTHERARVVWVKQSGGGCEAGLQFASATPAPPS